MTPDQHLTIEDLASAAGVSPRLLIRLLRLGLIEPLTPGGGTFAASSAARVRRMLRLHLELGVNLTGAAIILDLIERVRTLEARDRWDVRSETARPEGSTEPEG